MLDNVIIGRLRDAARRGALPSSIYADLKAELRSDNVVTALDYVRKAFHLSLAEAKPLAALSRSENREIVDAELLNRLLMPAIERHRGEWDA